MPPLAAATLRYEDVYNSTCVDHGVACVMDAQQSTSAQHFEDWGARSGVLRIGGNTKFHMTELALVMTLFSLPAQCAT